jgi:hypothetical protein
VAEIETEEVSGVRFRGRGTGLMPAAPFTGGPTKWRNGSCTDRFRWRIRIGATLASRVGGLHVLAPEVDWIICQ